MPTDPKDVDPEYFRDRARVWLADHAPRRLTVADQQDPEYWSRARSFQRMQHAAGFAGIAWDERYGGQGLSLAHQMVFNDEAAGYELPSDAFQITLAILGMTILEHGSEEQKEGLLPEMLRGESVWVQLLSEPGAGSDLAAARMRAERDGDEWILNGEKVWSSFAQWSDHAMVLARTDWDVPKHAGLTMFVMRLDTPGVTLLPLRQMSGDEEFCQEFFDDVRLGADAVLGKVNGGWPVASAMFKYSRLMTSGAGLTGPTFAKDRGGDPDPGRELIDLVNASERGSDPHVRQLIAHVVVDNVVSGLLANRIAANPDPNAGNIAKMFGALVLQRRCEIELELRGESFIGWAPEDAPGARPLFEYLKGRTASVAGGTHEVMKNNVGERLLGLPREPQLDKDLPFRAVIRDAH
ncbi:MAG TPA: acyl-CoA dehydrogenase family protein [Acidimicrobiia bacterium]|nr:acyl-CoA dehydrogenase family protein [Acidimicrobiia bacterium]